MKKITVDIRLVILLVACVGCDPVKNLDWNRTARRITTPADWESA